MPFDFTKIKKREEQKEPAGRPSALRFDFTPSRPRFDFTRIKGQEPQQPDVERERIAALAQNVPYPGTSIGPREETIWEKLDRLIKAAGYGIGEVSPFVKIFERAFRTSEEQAIKEGRMRPEYAQWTKPEYEPKDIFPELKGTTGEKVAQYAGEMLGSLPEIALAYGPATKITEALIKPEATGLLARAGRAFLPGAMAGAGIEGAHAAIEGEPPSEIAKEAAIGAAAWGGGDVAARALSKAALAAWQRLRTTPKPEVPVTSLTALERPLLAPPAAPGEGRVFRPVSSRFGPIAKPVPAAAREIPRPAEPAPAISKPVPVEAPPAVPSAPVPKDKFSAPGGLNGKALYLDGKIIYPSEIAAKADEVAGNFDVTAAYLGQDAGHDALYLARAAKSGDEGAIDDIFGAPGVHITKEGNSFTLRFDPDGFMREMHGYSDIDVFNKLFDATQALYKEGYKNNKLFIPELRYKGTIEEFLGKPIKPGVQIPIEERTLAAPEFPAPKAMPKKPLEAGARKKAIEDLAAGLQVPIRVGRMGYKALGIYKQHPQVIRTAPAMAEDLRVVAHEAGHHLDRIFNLRQLAAKDKDMRKELIALGKSQPARHFTEGIAEFTRHYVAGVDMTQHAPKFLKLFEETVSKEPKAWEALQKFKADYQAYTSATAQERVRAAISTEPAKEKRLSVDRIMTAWVDELRPLDTLVQKVTGGKPPEPSKNPFLQAWLARGWTGKASLAVNEGVFSREGKQLAPGLKQILQPVANRIDDFEGYLVAERAIELKKRGIEPGIDLADAEATAAKFRQDPAFQKAKQELMAYQDVLLDNLVVSGILTPKARDAMRELNQHYVPFYRVFDENAAGMGFGKRGYGDLPQPIKRIKGSGRSIISPLESIVKNTYYLTNIAERNNVGRTLVEFVEKYPGMGRFVEKVPPKMEPVEVNVGEAFAKSRAAKAMQEAGLPVKEIKPLLDELVTVFRPHMMGNPKENIIAVWRNGKRELYQLDPELYRTTQMLDKPSFDFLTRIMSYPTSWLRAGATLSLEFMVRNPLRDAWTAWVYSRYGFIPLVDTARGLFHALKRDDLYKLWMASGGANGNFVSLDRDYLQQDLRRVMRQGAWERMKHYAVHPLELLREFSELSEKATRLGEFRKATVVEARKTGGVLTREGLERAALASRDVTLDFSRMGTVGKTANQWVAFFNAAVQGIDKMRREFTKGGIKGTYRAWLKATTGITLPSVILWAANRGNPVYEELPQWRKDLFWNIIAGDTVISIPKPYEVGVLFGTSVERVLDWISGQDPEAMNELMHTVGEVTFPGWIPTALLPIIEVITGYDMFRGRPITPMGEQYLLKQEQYSPYTTEAAKGISRALGAVAGGEAPLSPREIEKLVSGYTGGLGRYGLQLLSAPMPKETPPAEIGAAEMPGLKAVVGRAYQQGSQSLDDFYARLEELEKKARTAQKYGEAGRPIPESLRYNEYELKRLRRVQKELAEMRKEREQILKSRLDPAEKRRRLDALQMKMINTARASLGLEVIR